MCHYRIQMIPWCWYVMLCSMVISICICIGLFLNYYFATLQCQGNYIYSNNNNLDEFHGNLPSTLRHRHSLTTPHKSSHCKASLFWWCFLFACLFALLTSWMRLIPHKIHIINRWGRRERVLAKYWVVDLFALIPIFAHERNEPLITKCGISHFRPFYTKSRRCREYFELKTNHLIFSAFEMIFFFSWRLDAVGISKWSE